MVQYAKCLVLGYSHKVYLSPLQQNIWI